MVHQHLRFEQVALGLEIARQRALDRGERVRGLLQIVALIPDLREIEPGAIADIERHVVVQQRAENAARFFVLAERQIQAALEQLGFDGVMREAIEILRGAEARQRLHVVVLVEVEQHVAPVQILHDLRRADQRLLFCRLCRAQQRARPPAPARQRRRRAADRAAPPCAAQWLHRSAAISLPFLDDEFRLRLRLRGR